MSLNGKSILAEISTGIFISGYVTDHDDQYVYFISDDGEQYTALIVDIHINDEGE